jgi:hypothetical protein
MLLAECNLREVLQILHDYGISAPALGLSSSGFVMAILAWLFFYRHGYPWKRERKGLPK